jgi:hypothetical protein
MVFDDKNGVFWGFQTTEFCDCHQKTIQFCLDDIRITIGDRGRAVFTIYGFPGSTGND